MRDFDFYGKFTEHSRNFPLKEVRKGRRGGKAIEAIFALPKLQFSFCS